MTESPYDVGYGRPPMHSRFQKGQSGNPGGRPGPQKLLKQHFDVALSEALNADEEPLRQSKPGTVVEAFARRLALRALDGRPSAERQVLAILERAAGDSVAPEDETENPPLASRMGPEDCRELLGDRYDEFRTRFDKAVKAGSVDDLLTLAEDFQGATEFPETGNS
jgi:hypothetical protein